MSGLQDLSHTLKARQNGISRFDKDTVGPVRRKKGVGHMMHEHGMNQSMMQQQEMLMEMWDSQNDDQKKILMKRMPDTRIMMKEAMIKHLHFKIETFKMIQKMLDEC